MQNESVGWPGVGCFVFVMAAAVVIAEGGFWYLAVGVVVIGGIVIFFRMSDRDDEPPLRWSEIKPETNRDQVEPSEETHPLSVDEAFEVFEDAYLVRYDEMLEAEVQGALDAIIEAGDAGVETLLKRLTRHISLEGMTITVSNLGDATWNELLKCQAIIEAFKRARVQAVKPRLESLTRASCNNAQFNEIVRPALQEALGAM